MSESWHDYQIMWNRLTSVVEEQAATMIRTAFSTSVREAGDLSAGLFDRWARMIAQAVTGTPGHVNSMAESVRHFVREIGERNIFEGDVYLTNDPWKGTGHLHDFTAVTPVFRNGGLIGFFACTAHVIDIGGRGFGPDAAEVFEEGLLVPICKFAERGVINPLLISIIRGNTRTPDQTVGDLYSLAACNEAGNRRLQRMMDEFGLENIDSLADHIVDTSNRATRKAISALPDGVYRNRMTVDGYESPVTMCIELTVAGDNLLVDFTGTSGMSAFGVNVPEVYTRAYSGFALKCAISPDIPNNAGSLEPFEILVPPGCILAAERPAPVSVRHVLGHFLPDVVLGALHLALPGRIPAEGASALWNVQISVRATGSDSPSAEILMFNSGGTGARPELDGLSATAFPSGVSTMSVEATEQVGPITVWRKELLQDSGGPGRTRGGLGQIMEIEASPGYRFWFNAMFDRVGCPARGRDGGGPGGKGIVRIADGEDLCSKGRQAVPVGKRLQLCLPGGGGWGNPSQRHPDAVRADIEAGYVSAGSAAEIYGYSETETDQ
ncbi:MAG: hydantoinase B/oxoprolinase family protein [Rhodobacteraceae bacterium]|nr:hydantoinase B/oxoprolinase family protein [Paracoccaceae bacterium]